MGVLALSTSLLLLPYFLLWLCAADDRILTGESLSMNETLVSDGGTFALGFFTLGASPPRRYLGIWYNNLPVDRTVVWVANNDKPFTDSPVVLRISNDSHLEVTNSAGAVLWSTNTAGGGGAAGGSMMAVLLGSGNLVLRAAENVVRWQSFDHLGNTVLPGMTMWFNTTTRRGNRFLSWKSADDPSPGDFTLGIDPATVLQIVIWKDNRTFWRYNPWDGFLFGGAGLLNNVYASYFSIQGSPDTGVAITFTSSLSMPQRLYLDHNGIFWILYWSSSSSQWISLWSNTNTNACEAYGACGPYGFCNETGSGTPACSCLPGYEPRVLSEWNRGNHSAGCARPAGGSDRRCDQDDVFATVGAMKLPDKMVYLKQVTSARDCEGACRSNCSCTAYAHANATNINVTTTRCFVWHGDLMDLVQYRASSPGESLHFRLLGSAPSGIQERKGYHHNPRYYSSTRYVTHLLCVEAQEDIDRRRGREQMMQYTSSGSILSIKNGKEAGEDVPLQSFEFITAITSNFSDSNKLGEGGFGKVYKGVMSTGEEIAIKRLSRGSSQGQEEFKNEVALIAKLQHRNLVKLVGSCIQGEERILIYEYVPNGSLNSVKQVQLDWETRFNIIKGIARGLMYLHQDSRFKIVHRDLKASNILLDEDMNPKISDFGMARMFGGNQSRCITHRVAWHMWKEENVMDFLDSSIASTSSPAQVSRCLHVGLLCVQDHVNKRPFMSSIVFMLENDTPIHDKPNRPMFMLEAAQEGGEVPKSGSTCPSVNDLSITAVEGR
ncbi:hypothetical protein Taro_045940 [Colocasia esculenta]|uniref:Receptor-like serine/threonine-protein kinase n=1 Tax=Colocasia esculenta TaxID=4460 RepID=A0A843X6Z0_COLES|nr:hypothetical protein [Colocasia esculenta]